MVQQWCQYCGYGPASTTESDRRACAARPDARARGVITRAPAGRERHQRLDGLIPRVQREIERCPVDRQERAAAQHVERAQRVRGPEMNRAPRRMPRADLDHADLERTVAPSDLPQLVGEAGIGREVETPRVVVSTNEDHSVFLFRSNSPRPEKCCAGVAVNESVPPATECVSHQSSSVMSAGRRRVAPAVRRRRAMSRTARAFAPARGCSTDRDDRDGRARSTTSSGGSWAIGAGTGWNRFGPANANGGTRASRTPDR